MQAGEEARDALAGAGRPEVRNLAANDAKAGTLVICRTTTEDACDSLATGRVGLAVSLTATSVTTTASTAVIAVLATRIRRRAPARLRAARSAAIRSPAQLGLRASLRPG
jgi:hypothetical protein